LRNVFKTSITSGLKAVLNNVRTPINNLISGINSVKNKIPGANLLRDIPTIPRFAQGGITSGPMLAMVGDNPGGKEVIAPLDRLQSMLTNSVIQAMQGAGGGQTGDVILNIDGRTFARLVKPFLDKEQSRIGQDIRIKTI
jgi:phage-related protein